MISVHHVLVKAQVSGLYHIQVYSGLRLSYWERADLMALVHEIWLCFCHFPMWCPGSGVVLDCIDSSSLLPFLLLYGLFTKSLGKSLA